MSSLELKATTGSDAHRQGWVRDSGLEASRALASFYAHFLRLTES